jgi:hypothetical protein
MAGIFSFKCHECHEVHEGSPSFSFMAPDNYFGLSETQRTDANIAELTEDVCRLQLNDHTDYFVRVCLGIPIHGVDEPFTWGIWVSLSADSLERYLTTWNKSGISDVYFGWLCNQLPLYSNTLHLKTRVHPLSNGQRPWLEIEPTNHPLARDFHDGITIARAQEMAELLMHAPATA